VRAFVSAVVCAIAVVSAAAAQAKEPKVPTGWIVFSIESDHGREDRQSVLVRRHGMDKTWVIATPGFLGTKYHFQTPNGPGSVIVKELPQGDYVALSIWMMVEGYEGTAPIGIPFMVESGKATYLGAFRPSIFDRKGWFGSRIPHSANYRLYDERARDLPLAAAMLPEGTETLENFAGYEE
jgi:hypothetical protein